MKIKSSLVIAALILVAALSYGGSQILADSETDTYPPFVETLANKLGIGEDEVADVFDEIRADHFAQMQEDRNDRLTQAVSDGVLTEEQKSALLLKWEDLQTERDQEMEDHRNEMKIFFDELGIDEENLHEYLGYEGMGMRHGPNGRGMHMLSM